MQHEETSLDEFRLALLNSIKQSDGKSTWYTLGRSVVGRYPMFSQHLMPVLRGLEAEGLIESVFREEFQSLPYYRWLGSGE